MKKLKIAALVGLLVAIAGCTAPPSPDSPGVNTAAGATCAYNATSDAAKPVTPPPTTGVPNTGTVAYQLKLNDKPVGITLLRESAPCAVNSFTSLAAQGFYDNTSCHRLVDSGLYVLQCGDPTGTGAGGPGYQFGEELTGAETYVRGTLAMAKAKAPGTSGSQFFMVFADSAILGPEYTVFGKIDEAGLKVIETIAKGGHDNSYGSSGGGKPNLPAVINSVRPR